MVYRYFALVILLSVPLWIAGHFINTVPHLPIALPVSALMAFLPAALALILVWHEGGASEAKRLLARAADWHRTANKLWYLPAVLFMPATLAIGYAVQQWMGVELPEPRIEYLVIPIFFAMFFAAGLGEEIGWQGYAYDRMKGSALKAALVIAAVWMVWHIVPFFQTGRSTEWVIWHCGVTILLRIVTVWLYVNGGRSVFIAALFHAMCNVAFFLYPVYGSHYDPVSTFIILGIATSAIVFLWGPQTLARFRFHRH